MNGTPTTQGIPKPFFKRHAVTLKLGWVFCLVLVLLIPLGMIRSILFERMNRRNQAVAEITSSWGGEQVVVGPVLVIPYQYRFKTWKEQIVDGRQERLEVEQTAVANAFFLPDELVVEGTATPSKLHRGIYEAVVYKSQLNISGRFQRPDFAALGIAETDVKWEKAEVTLAVSDLRGTGELLNITVDGQTYTFTPGCKLQGYPSGISALLPGVDRKEANRDFQMTLDLKGSRSIRFAPVGRQTQAKLSSPWTAPSFQGAFLPSERKFSEQGFEVSWAVSWYGRSYPQQSTNRSGDRSLDANSISSSLFGVDFIVPVDTYRMAERAIKYGVLFIALIFTAFILFEILSALRIHTIQYTLVGAALCLFYLAVLALSEFIPFGYAYWIGVLASGALIILYSLKILGSGMRTAIIAAALLIIYTYLYVILQLQDYSLLIGTAGLFIVLGIVMYSTRNLDWSTRE